MANGIVYLVKPAGDYSAVEKAFLDKNPDVVIDQINCEFVPYATVVHKDQKLTFKSSDPIGHNVDFKPFNNDPINPMLPPNGKVDYRIKKAEKRPSKAVCSIHPWMVGWVFIADWDPFGRRDQRPTGRSRSAESRRASSKPGCLALHQVAT